MFSRGRGQGGGENEGVNGVHRHFEDRNPNYVRRRCFCHLPWRVADQGLAVAERDHNRLKALSEYFHDGATWTRLQAISVAPVAEGGLGMCVEGDALFAQLFGRKPPKMIAERPGTAADLLEWLVHAPRCYARIVRHDVETRNLKSAEAALAAATLADNEGCVRRRIHLKRALYL